MLLPLSLLLTVTFTFTTTFAQPFSDCNLSQYYADTDVYDRTALHSLLATTHRNVLPYTSASTDVWDALIALDVNELGEIMLFYANRNVTAQEYGTSETWNREHVWPKSLGVGTSGPDYTDLHHLRPSDWNVNAARGNKLFGACGIVDILEDCVEPAHAQAASDTQTDNVIWLPPSNRRGDVARILMYMDVRYDGDATNELDLKLTDCPVDTTVEMGYLSQLLQWHIDDEVDDYERERNAKVCESYQGNRNPFIDYPDLAAFFFGSPQEANPPLGYTCDGSSNGGGSMDNGGSPSASPTTTAATSPTTTPAFVDRGTCNGLSPGDVMITAFNSDNPDAVAIVALNEIAAGATLFMTDNAWTGSAFRTNEGTLKYVVPSDGIPKRTVFGYNYSTNTNEWSSESGSFALSADGDTIILYCLESDDSITHLTALSYSGDWLPASTDEDSFGTASSALPTSLPSNTAIALSHKDNCWYVGPRQGNTSSLLDNLSDPNEWEGSNTEMFQLGGMSAKFMELTTSNATTITTFKKWIPLVCMAFVVIATTFYFL